jgi:filamentous hemagglutinin family protein
MFKFKVSYLALTAALGASFVYADPTTYTHLSGTKVVDIETPNAAGVSHNMYRDFNVDSKGMILNNSTSDLTHNTLGNIAKNNNLGNGSASVILNEVISNKSSSLNGFIEVTGQKADVIVANPNGISCSGCSFINTNKAVLTTGKVALSDTGAIASYTVTGGKLTIGKNGMDATNSYAVLLADAIAINGSVTATHAMVGGGNFTFDNSTGAMASAGKSATIFQTLIPEYSIDISKLGGIKANSISMTGNNLGFGVRNKGTIVANTTLVMSSNGSLINEGSITSNGLVTQMASVGNLKNTGNITTTNTTVLNTLSSLTNSGTISSTSQLLVNASGNIENSGTLKATNALNVTTGGNLKTTKGSTLSSDNQLVAASAGNIDNGGSIKGVNTLVTFGGNTLKVSGNIYGDDNLVLQAKKDDSLTGGEIINSGTISGGNVIVQTNGNIELAKNSYMQASDTLTTQSYQLTNKGYMSGDSIHIDNFATYNYGNIKGTSVTLQTYKELYNENNILATSDMFLSTQGYGNITNRGHIGANGTLTMTAKNVVNGGYRCGFFYMSTCGTGTLSATNLLLNSSHDYASDMGGTQQFKNTIINTVN